MVKRLYLILVLCLLCIFVLPVNADIIIDDWNVEQENNFYNLNKNQCVYLGRRFCVNSEYDLVSVKKEPGSEDEIAVIKSGDIVYIEYSCLYKGDYWGLILQPIVSQVSEQWFTPGWVKMNQMLVFYDYVAFWEDHFESFYKYSGDYGEIKDSKAVLVWPWPGANAPLWTIKDLNVENFRVFHAYIDEEGREWGFVTYLYGSSNIWVCLSDPLNRDITAFHPMPEPMLWISDTIHVDIGKSERPMLALIIFLVSGLAIGTIILIKVLWKPINNEVR